MNSFSLSYFHLRTCIVKTLNTFNAFPLLMLGMFIISVSSLYGQAPSSILPDIVNFKLEFPLDPNGNDYEGVDYNDRNSPHIKNDIETNLSGYVAPSPFNQYFYVSGNEVVFKSHCAGALTSVNAYPRCELRQRINGEDTFWDFSDEHELNATFRVTNLPNVKKEVCMLQIKGKNDFNTSNTKEVFRLEYRQGSQGLHLVENENTTYTYILPYSLNQTLKVRLYVNNDRVDVTITNVTTGAVYTHDYDSNYNNGYFKAGAYTQSSIWGEKNGVGDESPNAYGEVRFSELTLGDGSNTSDCVANVPGNRVPSNVGTSTARLNWTFDSNIDHYNVRYRKTGTSNWSYRYSIRAGSVDISNLTNNTTYQWQVRAKCADGSASSYNAGPGTNFTTGNNSGGNSDIVMMRKRNAMSYALDGGNGGANDQNVYLWTYSSNNNNQKWVEIDRGNGHYTYKKLNTNYCIDGGNGGAESQNVKLWTCDSGNENQHWKKISMGGGAYRLEKRNAESYSMDGKGGGANGQNVHLWTNNNNNYNQHWVFEVVGSSSAMVKPETSEYTAINLTPIQGGNDEQFLVYPNPFKNELWVELPDREVNSETSIRMTDAFGRVVFSKDQLFANDKVIITKELSAGIYFVQWIDEYGDLLQVGKVIRK